MRESGILMHITSLPGPWGIGTMGAQAYSFVDFLKRAGQRYWQILPLSPTGYGDSPYQSCSAFAGNHYLIDLNMLVEDGLLEHREVARRSWGHQENRVDFGLQYQNRLEVLRLAYGRFSENDQYRDFCRENASWLPDFALFMALKDDLRGQPWYQWPQQLKLRDGDAVWQERQRLKKEIGFYTFVQYLFFRQWNALHSYAHKNNVQIIGDVPIYVPYDSCDVWCNPELFLLDEDRKPTEVAGVPPDAFTADGQLWGNPLYRWDKMQEDDFSWWIRRLEAAGRLYDVVRLDHFRGLESYWSVPATDATAKNGRWIKGPDMAFVEALKRQLPEIRMIAEDLGYLTPEVLELRTASGYPGMKVLEFAFDSKEPSDYLPHTYTRNSVCYTGTHDNMTMRQWFETSSPEAVEYAKEYMALTEQEGYVWGVIRTAMSSVSDLCVVPIQDYLDLGGEARMNFPGTLTGENWTWRAGPEVTDGALADKIYKLTGLYARLGN